MSKPQSVLKFSGLGTFTKVPNGVRGEAPRKKKSLSLQDFRDSQSDVMSGAAGFRDSDVIIADLDYNAIIGFNTIIF